MAQPSASGACPDEVAIGRAPDVPRAAFRPYPTPLFDDHGNFTGAVNMLIDVSDEQASPRDQQSAAAARRRHVRPEASVSCRHGKGSSAPPGP